MLSHFLPLPASFPERLILEATQTGNAKTGVLCELLEFSRCVHSSYPAGSEFNNTPLSHSPLIGLRGRYTAGAAGFKMNIVLSPAAP